MKLKHAFLPAVLCAAMLSAAPVLGDEPTKTPTPAEREEAQRRYQRGRELYEENDFVAALVEIRRAYGLAGSYKLLFDIGQICYQTQDYPCALRSFSAYLAEGKDEVPAARKAAVQADIERLSSRVATLRITTSRPGAEIFVDDVSQGKTPLADGVLVGAGRRRITARLEGAAPVTKVIEVAGADKVDVALDIQWTGGPLASGAPTTSGTVPPPPDTGKGGRQIPILPWIATGALAIGAGVTGGLALGASSDYKSKLDTFGTTRSELDGAAGSMRALAITSDVLWGATAIAGVTAIVLTVTAGPKSSPAARLQVGPGHVAVTGSF